MVMAPVSSGPQIFWGCAFLIANKTDFGCQTIKDRYKIIVDLKTSQWKRERNEHKCNEK